MRRPQRLAATAALVTLLLASAAPAHDTWVETNTNLVRPGDHVHLSLMLGNHGNDHRDFKLAGKADLAASTLAVLAPDGQRYDLKDRLADTGYTPTEGFWAARFAAKKPGLYMAAHTYDKVVKYAPIRSVKSAKTFFVVSSSLDKVTPNLPGFDKVLGHPLELVAETNPVAPMGPGTAIKVRLFYKGKPLAKARVSFIPRGETLKEDFDARYERLTDAQGRARFTPTAGNHYLVVAHLVEAKDAGKGYKSTKYSATLTVYVPQVCPCCAE
jgi:uncharacterized GH25 family protein